MVELPRAPSGRVVTTATIIAERAAVWIIIAVARATFRISVVKGGCSVALFTGDIGVCAN